MLVLKERCPTCGGTIILHLNASVGECDSCGMTYSLSDLQKIKEALLEEYTGRKENDREINENEYYESALDTSEADEISLEELCQKTEMALESEQWPIANSFSDEILRRDPKFAKAYLYKLLAEHKVFRKENLVNLEKPFDDSDNYRLLIRFANVYLKTEIENYNEAVKAKYQASMSEDQYQGLCRKLALASDGRHYQVLADGFRDLGDYKDSKKLLVECQEKYKRAIKKEHQKKTLKKLLLGFLIFGVLFAIIGGPLLKRASYRGELFSVEVTDKVNVDYDERNVYVVFNFNIINESRHDATYLKGYMTVRDKEGTVLIRGSTWFRGDIASENENYFELSWELERNGTGPDVWNADFSELTVTYRITEIHFDDGTTREYKGKNVVVN